MISQRIVEKKLQQVKIKQALLVDGGTRRAPSRAASTLCSPLSPFASLIVAALVLLDLEMAYDVGPHVFLPYFPIA